MLIAYIICAVICIGLLYLTAPFGEQTVTGYNPKSIDMKKRKHNAILIAIGTYLFFYVALSGLGTMMTIMNFIEIITSLRWFIVYTILLGWWVSWMAARECYEDNY